MKDTIHKVEGISFNKKNVSSMDRKAFIDEHINVFFLDRPKDKRKEILTDIYDKIKGVSVLKVDD